MSLLARDWGEVLQVGLTISSITMGSVLGIFLLGLRSRTLGEGAALVAMVSGLTVVLAIHLLTGVAWTWYMLIGTAVTFSVGVIYEE